MRSRALKGINLSVGAGEVTCVLGDNGAGKSTLIKIMVRVALAFRGQPEGRWRKKCSSPPP